MGKIKKIVVISLVILLIFLALLKIFAAPILKSIAIKETEKFIKSTYDSDINLKIEELSLKIIDLAILKASISITNLSLGDRVQINQAETEINLYQLLRNKHLIFKILKINEGKIFLAKNFNFGGSNKKGDTSNKEPYLKKIFFNEITLNKLKLIISNDNFKNESLVLENINLVLNSLEFSNSPTTKKTNFNLKSDLKDSITNGHINLNGYMDYDDDSKIYSYFAQGEISKLNIQTSLRTLTGEKQGLSGRLSANNIIFKSSAKEADDFSKNMTISSQIVIREGSLYLLDYIIKAKQVINTAIPIKTLLEEGYGLAKDAATKIKNPKAELEKSAKSKNSKFTEFDADLEIKDEKIYLKNILIETPIIKLTGDGYNSFDKSMKYNLVASLAQIPVLPILIRTVNKVPIVFIDLHEFSLKKTHQVFNLLNITDSKDEKENSGSPSFFSKVKDFINAKIF